VVEYNINKPWLSLDEWQKAVLDTEGNVVLRSGRQVGKSTVVSVKAGEFAMNNPHKQILVVAAVERQAFLLFDKILAYLHDNYRKYIKKGKDRPTRSRISLTNGAIIRCLPTGLSGYGIRGYTIDLLIADEAAFIPEEVWTAITPMLAITRGKMILLSTPFGREGYFYRCFNDKTFTSFHVSSEDCLRKDVEFLKNEKERMSTLQYAQEYLGEFIDELRQFFPTELIRKCMKLKRNDNINKSGKYYLGVDVARMGEDETTFEIVEKLGNGTFVQVGNEVNKKTLTTETYRTIIAMDSRYKFRQIFIDDGGMGVGVFDMLLENNHTKRRVEAINNSSRPLDEEGKRKKKTMKSDIYNNLLMLMETNKIALLDDPEIFLSLKSVQYEYTDDKKIKIFGNYTHIADGLVRAAWASKNKSLNIFIHY